MTAAYSIAAPAGVATKVCSKCGECKPATAEFFQRQKGGKFGLRGSCKGCCSNAKPKKAIDSGVKYCPVCDQCKPATADFCYRSNSKPDGFQSICKICAKDSQKRHRNANQVKLSQKKKEYCRKNADSVRARKQRYNLENKDRLKVRKSEYIRTRRLTDPLFAFQLITRKVIERAFLRTGLRKAGRTKEILGCDVGEFKEHIERQFLNGMSWENRSEWHIDHIIPLATAKTEEDVIRLNHYTNLRPLWADDNLRKGARIDYII